MNGTPPDAPRGGRPRLALPMLLCAVGILGAAPRWWSYVRTQRDELRELAERRRVMQQRDSTFMATLRDSAAIRAAIERVREDVFVATSAVSGASIFAGAVRSAAEAAGLRLRSLAVSVDSARRQRSTGPTQLVRIRARGDAIGDMESMAQFLSTIDASTPRIAVPSMSMSTNDVYALPNRPEQLRTEFVMSALVWVKRDPTNPQGRAK